MSLVSTRPLGLTCSSTSPGRLPRTRCPVVAFRLLGSGHSLTPFAVERSAVPPPAAPSKSALRRCAPSSVFLDMPAASSAFRLLGPSSSVGAPFCGASTGSDKEFLQRPNVLPQVRRRFVNVQAREVQVAQPRQAKGVGSPSPTRGLPPDARPRRRRGISTVQPEGGRRVRRQEASSWRHGGDLVGRLEHSRG